MPSWVRTPTATLWYAHKQRPRSPLPRMSTEQELTSPRLPSQSRVHPAPSTDVIADNLNTAPPAHRSSRSTRVQPDSGSLLPSGYLNPQVRCRTHPPLRHWSCPAPWSRCRSGVCVGCWESPIASTDRQDALSVVADTTRLGAGCKLRARPSLAPRTHVGPGRGHRSSGLWGVRHDDAGGGFHDLRIHSRGTSGNKTRREPGVWVLAVYIGCPDREIDKDLWLNRLPRDGGSGWGLDFFYFIWLCQSQMSDVSCQPPCLGGSKRVSGDRLVSDEWQMQWLCAHHPKKWLLRYGWSWHYR